MKTLIALIALAAATGLSEASRSQDKPEMPKPSKEHEFLKNFEGTWESTMSMRPSPDAPWVKIKGSEVARRLGDFWVVSDWKSESAEMPMQGVSMTGYDPVKKKYVVTWAGSTNPALSTGEGTVSGRTLTTVIRSTDCQTGRPLSMKMTQEFKDDGTASWSLTMKDKDGKDFETMKGEAKRTK
jgi:hypothetical protein